MAFFLTLVLALSVLALPVPPAPDPESQSPGGWEIPESPRPLSPRNLHWLNGNRSGQVEGTVSILALLLEFSDASFDSLYYDFADTLGVETLDWFERKLERVRDYYRTVSGGRVDLQYSLQDSIRVLPGKMEDYGDDDLDWVEGGHSLALDAVALADPDLDFSAYDLVLMIHAGSGQESDLWRDSPEQLWSGYVDYESLQETFVDSIPGFQGIATADQDSSFYLQRFCIAPEKEIEETGDYPTILGTLGVYVHQMAGYLGMVSLNDYLEPRAQGAGNFELMSSGLWNALGFVPGPPSAFNRMLLGWADPVLVGKDDCLSPEEGGGLSLRVLEYSAGNGDSAILKFPISDREYFLVENRNQDANGDSIFTFDDSNANGIPDSGESLLGAEFDYYTTKTSSSDDQLGSGLLIWRIDEELLRMSFEGGSNVINAWNDHYGVCLLEADGYPDLRVRGFYSESWGSDFDAFRAEGDTLSPGIALPETRTSLDENSLPSTRDAEGSDTGWRFHSIGSQGPAMGITARWESDPNMSVEEVALPSRFPRGDPLLMEDAFLYLSYDEAGDSSYVSEVRDLVPEDLHAFEGDCIGSLLAGDLDGDGQEDWLALTRDGQLVSSLGSLSLGGEFHSGAMLFDLGGAPGMEILLAEVLPDSGQGQAETRLRIWNLSAGEVSDFGNWEQAWSGVFPGVPVSDPALGLDVPTEERGYDHPAPSLASFHIALADSVAGETRVWRLGAGAEEILGSFSLDSLFGRVDLACGDLDADGVDEILVQREGLLSLWYPEGRFGGPQAGEFFFHSETMQGFGGTVLPLDPRGEGNLEVLSLLSDAVSFFTADAVMREDGATSIPMSAPLILEDLPAVWALLLRDESGKDRPLLLSRDGRLFSDGNPSGTPLPIGGNQISSPLILPGAEGKIMGLRFFELAESSTAEEDTLHSSPRLHFWSVDSPSPEGFSSPWAMGGSDARRSRRLASSKAWVSSSGSESWLIAHCWPNPAQDVVHWTVESDSPDHVHLELYDLEGQLLYREEADLDGFSPWQAEVLVDGLAPGVYFYRIHSENSGRLKTGSLAVIR
ncbi:MAG: T9SS type A sorting domain-containing protein [Candidatus Krumholzibacteria bacterium]|nr:T9SS type A sorting domain-containing protein [Candidatus Krumholzibacteria bacterium]